MIAKFFPGVAAVAVAVVVLALPACGGADDTPSTTPESTATTPPMMGSAVAEVGPSEVKAGTLTITGASARATPNDVSAVYFTVRNAGEADRLIAASSAVSPLVQIHETVTEGSGMRMQEVAGGLEVPRHGELVLRPGGYHVMMLNLPSPLNVGQVIAVELTFEHAGTVRLQVPVREIASGSAAGGMGAGHG